MIAVILSLHMIAAIALVGVILLQPSEGGALGMGGGKGLMSARATGNLLTRATGILGAVFFATSLGLAVVASHKRDASFFDQVPQKSPSAPVLSPVPPTAAPEPAAPIAK